MMRPDWASFIRRNAAVESRNVPRATTPTTRSNRSTSVLLGQADVEGRLSADDDVDPPVADHRVVQQAIDVCRGRAVRLHDVGAELVGGIPGAPALGVGEDESSALRSQRARAGTADLAAATADDANGRLEARIHPSGRQL